MLGANRRQLQRSLVTPFEELSHRPLIGSTGMQAASARQKFFGGIPGGFTGADDERGELKFPDGDDRRSPPTGTSSLLSPSPMGSRK